MPPDPEDTSICPDCGYSLAGLSPPRCPECGADTRGRRQAILAARRDSRTASRTLSLVLPAALGACVWPFVAVASIVEACQRPAATPIDLSAALRVTAALIALASASYVLLHQAKIVEASQGRYELHVALAWLPLCMLFVGFCIIPFYL